jgi:hypothetical protein
LRNGIDGRVGGSLSMSVHHRRQPMPSTTDAQPGTAWGHWVVRLRAVHHQASAVDACPRPGGPRPGRGVPGRRCRAVDACPRPGHDRATTGPTTGPSLTGRTGSPLTPCRCLSIAPHHVDACPSLRIAASPPRAPGHSSPGRWAPCRCLSITPAPHHSRITPNHSHRHRRPACVGTQAPDME